MNFTMCSRVAVRFTSLLTHMESRLARAFVGGRVWQGQREILLSSWQMKDAIHSALPVSPSDPPLTHHTLPITNK